MTLRTVTYDDSTHKIVPICATEEINEAIEFETQKQISETYCSYVHEPWNLWNKAISAAPEYQEPTKDNQ